MTDTPSKPAKKSLARFAPIAAIIGTLVLAFALRLHEQLSLDLLRERREQIGAFVDNNLAAAVAIYMLVYVVVTAISLPIGLFVSITGGYLFGTWLGASATWIGATTGATLLFLAARTAIGDSLRKAAGPWLQKLEDGIRRDAFNYLLALRLFPWAPFFAVNLVPAFLGVGLRDYVLATLIGIVPATIVYAAVGAALRAALDAGTSLDPVQAIRNLLLTPVIIGPILGLIALSLLPVIAKRFSKKTET